jgi:hypothetical protein
MIIRNAATPRQAMQITKVRAFVEILRIIVFLHHYALVGTFFSPSNHPCMNIAHRLSNRKQGWGSYWQSCQLC